MDGLKGSGRDAFAQNMSAAAILGGLDLDWDGRVDIAGPRRGSSRLPRRVVPERHIVIRRHALHPWPVHPARPGLRPRCRPLEWAIEAALAAPPTRRDLAAAAMAEAVLQLRPAGAPATESVLETRFVQLARDHGLPTPLRQHRVEISPTTTYFVDFAWPPERFFIEVDGRQHDDQALHDADRIASVVLATGWNHIVLRHRQIGDTPRYTARRIARLLAAAPTR